MGTLLRLFLGCMWSQSQLEERCYSSEMALVCHDLVPITISCFVSSDETLSGRSGCTESATPTNWRPGVLRNLATDEAMTQCPEALGKLVLTCEGVRSCKSMWFHVVRIVLCDLCRIAAHRGHCGFGLLQRCGALELLGLFSVEVC